MKRMILFIIAICFCQASVWGVNINNQVQQANQQTDKERKEAEKKAKEQAKEEERRRKEEERRAKQQSSKRGCPFSPVRPIPEGSAVVYLYKAPYGKDDYPIAAKGRVITYLHRGGYFPFITKPGKLELFMASKDTGSGAFFSNPEIVLDVESGREYYLELTTRFSAKLNVHTEEKGLKKIQDDLLLLPYERYVRDFERVWQVEADPAFVWIRKHYPKDTQKVSHLKDLVETNKKFKMNLSFEGGTLRLSGVSEQIRLVVEQHGFAPDCADLGVPSSSGSQ